MIATVPSAFTVSAEPDGPVLPGANSPAGLELREMPAVPAGGAIGCESFCTLRVVTGAVKAMPFDWLPEQVRVAPAPGVQSSGPANAMVAGSRHTKASAAARATSVTTLPPNPIDH